MPAPLLFYVDVGGAAPALEFLQRLADRPRRKCYAYLKLVEDHDPRMGPLPENYVKKVSARIYEARPEWGNVEYRLLWAYLPDGSRIVLHGLIKKGRKLPPSAVTLAEQRLRDYEERTHT